MNETVYLEWDNGFLQVSDGRIAFKYDEIEDVICDDITNFMLLMFECNRRVFARDICFDIGYTKTLRKYRIKTSVKADEDEKFLRFRDIMDAHGVFVHEEEAKPAVEKQEEIHQEEQLEIKNSSEAAEETHQEEEDLYIEWGKSYLQVRDGKITIKHKGSFVMNGVLGGKPTGEVICDEIENFSLLYFQILMKRSVNFILYHEKSGSKYRIEIYAKAENVKKFKQFFNIMKAHGVYEDKSRMEIFYGKDSEYQKSVQVIKNRKKEIEEENKIIDAEDQEFYDKVKTLPGFEVAGTRMEMHHLRTMLRDNEQVFAIASGIMDMSTWMIACTDQRVLFIDCGMLYGVKHTEIMIDKINAVSFENRLSYGDIRIQDASGTKEITTVSINSTKPFVDAVYKAMELQKQKDRVVIQNQATSAADELLKYKQLLDMGAITEEEFTKLKKNLIK